MVTSSPGVFGKGSLCCIRLAEPVRLTSGRASAGTCLCGDDYLDARVQFQGRGAENGVCRGFLGIRGCALEQPNVGSDGSRERLCLHVSRFACQSRYANAIILIGT